MGKGRELLAPCFSACFSEEFLFSSARLQCSLTQAPRLSQCDQELSLVLIIFNWALAAGLWCFQGFLLSL